MRESPITWTPDGGIMSRPPAASRVRSLLSTRSLRFLPRWTVRVAEFARIQLFASSELNSGEFSSAPKSRDERRDCSLARRPFTVTRDDTPTHGRMTDAQDSPDG